MRVKADLMSSILLTTACGGGSTGPTPITVAAINDTLAQANVAFAGDDLTNDLLNSTEIAANGTATYQGVAGIGFGAGDAGGVLGDLSMTVAFSETPTVNGTADGFVVVTRAMRDATSRQYIADDTDLQATDGELRFSGGAILTSGALSVLGFDVDGTVTIPEEAGLAVGSGALTVDGRTGVAVTDTALISDFNEVAASRSGTPVAVGMSIYASTD